MPDWNRRRGDGEIVFRDCDGFGRCAPYYERPLRVDFKVCNTSHTDATASLIALTHILQKVIMGLFTCVKLGSTQQCVIREEGKLYG